MKIKQKSRRPQMIAAMIVVLVLGVGIGGAFGFFRNHSLSDLEPETPTEEKVVSMFAFSGVADWRKGPRNETSMAVFSKAREDGTSACFASIQYRHGTLDVDAVLQKEQQDVVKFGGSMAQTSVVSSVLRTSEGDRQYDLHQFSLTAGSSEKIMGGLALGYVQLTNGYVQIESHCETAEELASTIPALQAYELVQ